MLASMPINHFTFFIIISENCSKYKIQWNVKILQCGLKQAQYIAVYAMRKTIVGQNMTTKKYIDER